jgi:3-dehydroquinate dehydratase II
VRVDVLNGVNLDLLGRRDAVHYGDASLQDLETQIYAWARPLELQVRCRQTNHEGEYVEFLHAAMDNADGLVLNPGAWSHYSWAIRDALEIARVPVVEVHLSDVSSREEWRRFSVLDGLVREKIQGEGPEGYRHGLELLKGELQGEEGGS